MVLEIIARAARDAGFRVEIRDKELTVRLRNPGEAIFRRGPGRKRKLSEQKLQVGQAIASLNFAWSFDSETGTLSIGKEKAHVV